MANEFLKRSHSPDIVTAQLQKRIEKMKKNLPSFVWENRLSVLDKESPLDDATEKLLRGCAGITMPPPVTLQTIIDNSEAFSPKFTVHFPSRSSELRKRISDTVLESHANSVYPIIHEDVLPLIADWLENKRQRGTAAEKCLYQKMGLIDLAQRILDYKPFCSREGKDRRRIYFKELEYMSRWDDIGTDRQTLPLVLEDYLSNDEVKLSAFITVSSHTGFVVDHSCDVPEKQPRGVFMVVNGSKPTLMEYVDIEIAYDQNTVENGYGASPETTTEDLERLRSVHRVWAKFYDQPYFPLFEEVLERLEKSPEDRKYIPWNWGKRTFDAETYIKRTLITAVVILLEANVRAMKLDTTAYIHVIGFGLEVYAMEYPEQRVLFLQAFKIAIKRLINELQYVSDVMFAYFETQNYADGLSDGGNFGHINIHFGETNAEAVLESEKLLVVTYGWDGTEAAGTNSWLGKLAKFGDQAVGSITQMGELHTPQINPRASASCLHIASPKYGILHVAEYAKRRL